MSSDKQYPFLSNEKKVCGFVKKAFRYKPFVCRRRSSRPIDYRRLSLLYTALEVSSSFGHSWYLYQRILEAHRPMDSRSFVHYSFPRNPCIHGAIHIVSTHDIVYFLPLPLVLSRTLFWYPLFASTHLFWGTSLLVIPLFGPPRSGIVTYEFTLVRPFVRYF